MTDIEKVIHGIECCTSDPDGKRNCDGCPYSHVAETGGHCQNLMHKDAIDQLESAARAEAGIKAENRRFFEDNVRLEKELDKAGRENTVLRAKLDISEQAYKGTEELLRQKTALFEDMEKRMKDQDAKLKEITKAYTDLLIRAHAEPDIILAPCPFCGGQARFMDCGEPGAFEDWGLECTKCGTAVFPGGEEPGSVTTKAEAAAAWNRRKERPE